MVTHPPQDIEDNVVQFIKELVEQGEYPHPLPQLGPYGQLCGILLEYMPTAPNRRIREGMLNAVRRVPANKPFDDLLKRKFDP
jgi:hypothetical protein